MERYEAGMLAWSRAGHDKGKLYVVCKVEEHYLYLTDGVYKTLDKPKKKKKMHVQIIREIPEEWKELAQGTITNDEIRKIIRRFTNVKGRCY